MDFSLFFFSADATAATGDRYRLLRDAACFGDKNGFSAVWTPERHFHEFGGPYPNPSLLAAAIAPITERISLRAGSVVLPLHDPVRVAEEWAVVDNLSRGRAEVAFSTGWLANDFAIAPDAYEERKEIAFRGIEEVRALWRGEAVERRDGVGKPTSIRTFPRPVQAELPYWITTGFSPEMFARAGAIGADVLTALLSLSVEQLAERIALYREARAEHGHDPDAGRVAVMLHAFVGEDVEAVREMVRLPFLDYLRSHAQLVKSLSASTGLDIDGGISAEDELALASFAFERYFRSSSLMGTVETCVPLLRQLEEVGATEVACLLDFGVDEEAVLESLPHLVPIVSTMSSGDRPSHR